MELLDEYMLDDIVEHLANREKIKIICCSKKYEYIKISVNNVRMTLNELTKIIEEHVIIEFSDDNIRKSFQFNDQNMVQIYINISRIVACDVPVSMESLICTNIFDEICYRFGWIDLLPNIIKNEK